MRHKAQVSTFGRSTGARKALIRGLVYSLVEHGRVKTTLAKAKELRRHAERAVTLSKKGTLHARRVLLARYPNKQTIETLMTQLGPEFKTRPGGYTRIIKIDRRAGDNAEMAFIEWLNYDASEKKGKKAKSEVGEDGEIKATGKAKAKKAAKAPAKKKAKKKAE